MKENLIWGKNRPENTKHILTKRLYIVTNSAPWAIEKTGWGWVAGLFEKFVFQQSTEFFTKTKLAQNQENANKQRNKKTNK